MSDPCGGNTRGGDGCRCDPPFIGMRLRFVGFGALGDPCWDLQVDTPWVGFIEAPTLAAAIKRVEAATGRTDWVSADPVSPRLLRA